MGPHLNGVLGRVAGGIEGFKYSNPMAAAGEDGLIWTEDTLAEYKKDEDLAAITAYLASFGE